MDELKESNYPRVFEIEEILTISWAFYKKHFLSLAIISLIAIIPNLYVTLNVDTDKLLNQSFVTTNFDLSKIDFNSYKLLFLSSLFSYFALVTNTLYINDTLYNEQNTILEALLKSFKIYIPFVISIWIFAIGLALGAIMLIVPGIIFGVFYGFMPFILILKRKRIFESFAYSMSLVVGRFFKSAFYFLALILLNFAILIPLSLITKFLKDDFTLIAVTIISALLSNLIHIALVVFFINFDDTKTK